MIDHIQINHPKLLKMKNFTCRDRAQLDTLIETIEERSICRYNRTVKTSDPNVTHMLCFRDGRYRPSNSSNALKRASRVLPYHCMSRITIRENQEGDYDVRYIPNHTHPTNPATDLKQMGMPESTKSYVGSLSELGVRSLDILRHINGL